MILVFKKKCNFSPKHGRKPPKMKTITMTPGPIPWLNVYPIPVSSRLCEDKSGLLFRANPLSYDRELQRQRCKKPLKSISLRFENQTVFFYFDKRSILLQCWPFSCKIRRRWIGSWYSLTF
jgi:hypothetical protein